MNKNMIAIREKTVINRPRLAFFSIYFFAADRSNAPVNKEEMGPNRSKFHVPQIACDDTNYLNYNKINFLQIKLFNLH